MNALQNDSPSIINAHSHEYACTRFFNVPTHLSALIASLQDGSGFPIQQFLTDFHRHA